LAKEGWLRDREDFAKPPSPAQTGAERKRDSAQHQERLVQAIDFMEFEPTTPSAPDPVASRHLLDVASTPPYPRRGI
jgi:hypothetical protein